MVSCYSLKLIGFEAKFYELERESEPFSRWLNQRLSIGVDGCFGTSLAIPGSGRPHVEVLRRILPGLRLFQHIRFAICPAMTLFGFGIPNRSVENPCRSVNQLILSALVTYPWVSPCVS